jgi:F0F1-type ATP synthase membrane subunit a
MILELVLASILFLLFTRLAAALRTGEAPRGRFANLFEAMILFVRDQIARPAIDSHDHHDDHSHDDHADAGHSQHNHGTAAASTAVHAVREHHDGDQFVPLLLTLFFFVLGCN